MVHRVYRLDRVYMGLRFRFRVEGLGHNVEIRKGVHRCIFGYVRICRGMEPRDV